LRTEKEEIIIKLRREGKTWDQIVHKALVSHTTVKNTLAEYEQSQAFELFDKGFLPTQVKIQLGITSENTEKHFLAHRRLTDLVDLAGISKVLGKQLPDFLDFYRLANSCNITPYNMNTALNLAKNIDYLKEQNSRMQTFLQETSYAKSQEGANLAEIQRQSKIAGDMLMKFKGELQFIITALEKIKISGDYLMIRDIIFEAVNSLSTERYYLLAALIAVMKKIQKDPTIIPLLQFPFPQDLDMTAHTYYHDYTLTKIISEAEKLMPEVIEEMTTILISGILVHAQSYINSNGSNRNIIQTGAVTSSVSLSKTEVRIQPQDPVEVANPIPTKQERGPEKAKQMPLTVSRTDLALYQLGIWNPYADADWDILDDAWYYMY
jgi:hypothetical protein